MDSDQGLYPAVHGLRRNRTYSRTNRDILGQLIDPAGLVYPIKNGAGDVTNC